MRHPRPRRRPRVDAAAERADPRPIEPHGTPRRTTAARASRTRSRLGRALVAVAACGAIAGLPADAELRFRPQDYRTKATFELVVEAAQAVKPGKSTLVTESAFATRVRGLTPGNSDGLQVQFFTKPITEASRTDLLADGARELRKGSHAVLVLFLGKDGRVWQANLTQVMPGTTVGRTVAWKPEELAQLAPFRFDGTRLLLRSKGVYRESGTERLTMSWEVDLDLPVFDPATP